ncbi:DUF2726 domain-containing protein [Phenylobacterium kunshanense]|uniref:DUF2726 domain-containing protein n=1 Tax=Phenylobacterium kunshanense TaxID=1445034 RepID=A0A328BPQ2_9CAUL|nr:DUF2726 domain-containing protein [Phenylobacterium kunshanense]RAK69007.1 hypothetical protein DJ019_03080 [Phenylobacterium kunshanense]
MSPEIVALIDKPHLLIIVICVGAAFGMAVERFVSRMRRRAWRRTAPPQSQRAAPHPSIAARIAELSDAQTGRPRPDAADQLRIVMGATFTIQPVLNRGEARLFRELDRAVTARNPDWQVLAQVSLGEILRSRDAAAYGCINAKRIDLLLMDEACRPRHAIEYQGAGHHQTAAAARDAVKKEALRRAGVGFHEVVAGQTTPADLRRLVEKLVDAPEAATRPPTP